MQVSPSKCQQDPFIPSLGSHSGASLSFTVIPCHSLLCNAGLHLGFNPPSSTTPSQCWLHVNAGTCFKTLLLVCEDKNGK